MSPNERRLRKLEQHVRVPDPSGDKCHIVLVHPGETAEAEIAKLVDYEPGDEIFRIHFVSPADVTAH